MAEQHQDITRHGYDSIEAYRASHAKAAIKSAWHYWAEYVNPERPPRIESDLMIRGTLAHELALENRTTFAVFEGDKVRQPKDWKAFKEGCEANGVISIGKDSGTLNAKDVTNSANSAKEAIESLGITGDKECGITFTLDGLPCKSLVDILGDDGIVYDLKFTDSIEPRDFERRVRDLKYHFQIAWYLLAVKELTGKLWDHRFITIQPTYPYDWNIHRLHEDLVQVGFRDVQRAIDNLNEALASGEWTHPPRELQIATPPSYFYFEEGEYPNAVRQS